MMLKNTFKILLCVLYNTLLVLWKKKTFTYENLQETQCKNTSVPMSKKCDLIFYYVIYLKTEM